MIFSISSSALQIDRDWKARPLLRIRYGGELGQGGLEVFDDLKLGRCPHSLAPTLVTLPSMSLIPFAPFSGMMSGSSAGRARMAAASFTAGGTETLSVPREAGQPLIPK